ncbi:hypothetical protein AgCh_009552 [Apium graveolens]
MVYKNFKKGRRFSIKGSSSSNSNKRNNRRNTDGKESRSGKLDKSRERCYNCDGLGHFAVDCRKPRAEKKQALISIKRNWDDSSDSDDGVNYALIEKADVEAHNAELKEKWKKTQTTEPIKFDSKVKLNKVQIKTIKFNPSVNTVKSIHEEGTTSTPRSNLITEKSEQVYINSVNIGSMSQKQLKQKLKDLHMKDKRKRGYHVNFYEGHCETVSKSDGKITLSGVRHGSLYEARVSTSMDNSKVCQLSRASVVDSWNWNKRLSHLDFNNINELVRKDLVRGLPNAVFTPDGL